MTPIHRRDALRLLATAALTCGTGAAMAASRPGMITRPIHSSGETLPVIGLGTWQTFDVGSSDRAPLHEVLREFTALGGRIIDSSPMYGRSEEVVGTIAAEQDLQRKLFVATKVWTEGRRKGVAQMEDSMRKLRVKRVDLMQVHNLVGVDTHLATLREWKTAGRVRYIGITHYHSGAYAEVESVLKREKLDFLQINYSVAEREAERRLLPLAREKGVAIIVNRPFASGALFSRLRAKPVPEWAADIDCTTWAQLLLKFVVSHPSITCAIPATSKVHHLRDNMAAGRGRMPDAAMRARIAAL